MDDDTPAAPAPLPPAATAGLDDLAMRALVEAAPNEEGLVGHNLRAFNRLVDQGIPQILTESFNVQLRMQDRRAFTEVDRTRESIDIAFSYSDVHIGTPTYGTWPVGKITNLLPNEARITGRTYAAPLSLAAKVTLTAYYSDGRTATREAEIPQFLVAPIPVMVGSSRCHTANMTRAARKAIGEDPSESGGYFIAGRGEYVVEWTENIKFNTLHVHRKVKAKERVRGEFISQQPGGAYQNSSQIIIRYMETGELTVEINSTKFSKVAIPFFLLFRLLGMTSDRDVLERIVYDPASESPVVARMRDIVGGAMLHVNPAYAELRGVVDRETLTQTMAERLSTFVTNPTAYRDNEAAVQYLTTNLLKILDTVVLPHVGLGADARATKLRYLGMLIHKTLLVEMGILAPTDRDSYANKRVHGPGVSVAKAFKTQFNSSIVSPQRKALRNLLRNSPFEEVSASNIVDAFKSPLQSSDLARTLEQAITSGKEVINIRGRAVANRVSSKTLERKNGANLASSLRAVNSRSSSKASKQTERADRRRRVHSSFVGYICPVKSADTGETVGVGKEMALTASVCAAGEVLPLKLRLLADPAVTPLADVVTPDIERLSLARVFINGEWVGCAADAAALVARYRALRRAGRVVGHRTSVVWDTITNDVEFLLDAGRLTRPLLIVDNNVAAYDAGARAAAAARAAGDAGWRGLRVPFAQNVGLTPALAAGLRAGRTSVEDLRAAGVLEWVTPEEAENCYVASTIHVLRARAADVTHQYTHCDVEQALFGVTALISPYAGHTQPARVTYETNQGRQSGGWYSLADPYRVDTNRFFQWYNEMPLVRTIANNWLTPNGVNTIVAYQIRGGWNQEDSSVAKASFVARDGLAGGYRRFVKSELEKGETFRTPDVASTKNLKPNASYEKLVDGFVQRGAIVRKGDVLIGKVARIPPAAARRAGPGGAAPPGEEAYRFIDRSLVYNYEEDAVVTEVLRPRGANDAEFGIVKLRYFRPLNVGSKMSSRQGNKAIVARLEREVDMPFDDDGVTPDLIVNPHSVPSRMIVGQMVETSVGLVGEARGAVTDGTAFAPVDLGAVARELARVGLRPSGLRRLYDGRTGEWCDCAIFVGPTFHQRIQKFIEDDKNCVGATGPTDALTGQPLAGKKAHGGIRMGEMEAWVLESHGAPMTILEKMFADSDGRAQNVCRGCGSMAIFNGRAGIYRCNECGEGADISTVASCKASIAFQHEVRTSNVKLRLGLRPHEFADDA